MYLGTYPKVPETKNGKWITIKMISNAKYKDIKNCNKGRFMRQISVISNLELENTHYFNKYF